ncbi:MAG: hypothetical protein IPM29_06880 [Planctomycetes bacterium]|nr:hypothetical protein [Planctomycetota bacterium]
MNALLAILLPIVLWGADLSAPPAPDLVPLGYRKIHTEVVLESAGGAPGARYAVEPADGANCAEIRSGMVVAMRYSRPIRIAVVTAGEEIPEQPDEAWWLGHAFVELPIWQEHARPETSPIRRARYTVRLVGADGGAPRYEIDGPVWLDANGEPVDTGAVHGVMLGLAGVGLVGLLAIALRRRAAARAARRQEGVA